VSCTAAATSSVLFPALPETADLSAYQANLVDDESDHGDREYARKPLHEELAEYRMIISEADATLAERYYVRFGPDGKEGWLHDVEAREAGNGK